MRKKDYGPISNKKKQSEDSAPLILLTTKLLETTSEVADRCGLSNRDHVFFASS